MVPKALTLVAVVGAASTTLVPQADAAPRSERSAKNQSVKPTIRHRPHYRSYRHRDSARSAFGYRNHPWPDPSFDRSGRPYRPNFYSPCTVDLGYGRFASCDSWND